MSDYVIIRSLNAGCFFGRIKERLSADRVVLDESRRLWYWAGAASLSQLAIDGTRLPQACKFPEALDGHEVLGVIEVIPVSENGEKSIKGVPAWKA